MEVKVEVDHTPLNTVKPPFESHSHDYAGGGGSGSVNLVNLDPTLWTRQGGFIDEFMAWQDLMEEKGHSFNPTSRTLSLL